MITLGLALDKTTQNKKVMLIERSREEIITILITQGTHKITTVVDKTHCQFFLGMNTISTIFQNNSRHFKILRNPGQYITHTRVTGHSTHRD